jgi:hypothetical protein
MYGPPDTEDPPAWFAEMDRLLKGYRDDILDKAGDLILRTNTTGRFPTVSMFVTACTDVAEGFESFKKLKPEDYRKPLVDPEEAKRLMANFTKSMDSNNTFADIIARCPREKGSTVDLSRPWGEEVHDPHGNIVPIRKRRTA